MSARSWKLIKIILLLGSVFAALKLIFIDYTLDEEYQIVMAYRNLSGDSLFKQMWEPHQTSAFLCAGLIGLYQAILGTTTGVILFLRLFTLAVQIFLSYWIYSMIRNLIDKNYAFLLTMLYFNIVPKNIQIPEFSNMQLWFLTIAVLLLMLYLGIGQEKQKGNLLLPVGVGVALSCEILTYPTCIILFPIFLYFVIRGTEKRKGRAALLLTGTCVVCGTIWLLGVFSNVGFSEFLENVQKLLSFDVSHDVSGVTSAKASNYLHNFKLWALMLLGISLAAAGVTAVYAWGKKRSQKCFPEKKSLWAVFWVTAILVAEGIQIYQWMILDCGYEYLQIHLLVIWVAAAFLQHFAGEKKKVLTIGIIATLAAYVGVMYISDLAMYYTLPHGSLGIIFACMVVIYGLEHLQKEQAKPLIYILLISLCVCSLVGKGYTLRGGKPENNVLAIGGIMKDGPAAGIIADYMNAYIYNSNYADYKAYIQEGENVLIVANMIMSAGTTPYLFSEANVSHYSIVDPTAYDERLLTYWELYPEKYPDVIVVDCWYGQLMENPENWIMQYIEKDFGYTEVHDGSYVRFYRR